MKKLKQDLSVDDVYTIIQDFDEDGGGELDHEEFEELCYRMKLFDAPSSDE